MAEFLIKIAQERGLPALYANVLPENKKMLQVFNKVSVEHTSKFTDGVVSVKFKLK